jgi:hypothetical protein
VFHGAERSLARDVIAECRAKEVGARHSGVAWALDVGHRLKDSRILKPFLRTLENHPFFGTRLDVPKNVCTGFLKLAVRSMADADLDPRHQTNDFWHAAWRRDTMGLPLRSPNRRSYVLS